MGKVSVDQIRERLKSVDERRRFYEEKSEQPRRLALHEVWRHAYLARPYLIGAPDERVAERFRHIFMNISEIGESGKLQVIPLTETDEFMQTFTHMLEEFDARGAGIPKSLIESAREPIHRYFKHGTPLGITMFSGYTTPAEPILVKYGKREFLEPMLQTGKLRLANARFYNNASHSAAVRDDETSRTFFIPTYRERIEGKTHFEMQGHRIEFGDDDVVLPLVFDDYYLFSMCEQIHYRMPTDFEADAAIVIKNPEHFKQRLIAAFLAHFADWDPMEGKVTYYDPYRDYTKFRIPEMAKHFGYAYQKEVRIAFRARRQIATNLEPLSLSIGSMTNYADLVSL
jgi:hypothetical protein